MPELVILVGPPGSGKSYYRANHKQGHIEISQDEQGKEQHYTLFSNALSQGKDIIVDRMNFNKKQRAKYVTPAIALGYTIHCIVFHTPKTVCLQRATDRKDHQTIKDSQTASKVINFFFSQYEKPEYLEGYATIGSVTPDYIKLSCIVIDLDGTLCNIDHRLHHVREKPKRWDLFFKEIPNDRLNKWCAEIVYKFSQNKHIIFCSGRGEEYRTETVRWLNKSIGVPYALFMRPSGDSRPDDIIKETILDFDILPIYSPLFFVDDRDRVVNMWRRRGFICLQCAKGDF